MRLHCIVCYCYKHHVIIMEKAYPAEIYLPAAVWVNNMRVTDEDMRKGPNQNISAGRFIMEKEDKLK